MSDFNDDVTAKYADKIAKLLAKAESTSFQEEADALFAKVQELMTEHSITESMLSEARGVQNDSNTFADGEVWFTGTFMKTTMLFALHVAENNGVKTIFHQGLKLDGKKAIKCALFGYKSDVLNVEVLVNSLQLQCAKAMRAWMKTDETYSFATTQMEKLLEKREFIFGFQKVISQRLYEASAAGRRAAEEAAAARNKQSLVDAKTSVSLVVQNKEQLVTKEWHQRFKTKKTTVHARSRGSDSSNRAGQRAGQRADIGGRTSMGGNRKALS